MASIFPMVSEFHALLRLEDTTTTTTTTASLAAVKQLLVSIMYCVPVPLVLCVEPATMALLPSPDSLARMVKEAADAVKTFTPPELLAPPSIRNLSAPVDATFYLPLQLQGALAGDRPALRVHGLTDHALHALHLLQLQWHILDGSLIGEASIETIRENLYSQTSAATTTAGGGGGGSGGAGAGGGGVLLHAVSSGGQHGLAAIREAAAVPASRHLPHVVLEGTSRLFQSLPPR